MWFPTESLYLPDETSRLIMFAWPCPKGKRGRGRARSLLCGGDGFSTILILARNPLAVKSRQDERVSPLPVTSPTRQVLLKRCHFWSSKRGPLPGTGTILPTILTARYLGKGPLGEEPNDIPVVTRSRKQRFSISFRKGRYTAKWAKGWLTRLSSLWLD